MKMKKTLLASSVLLALGATGSAYAAFTAPTAGMYTMEITGGCFEFGDCVTLATGALQDATTAAQASFAGFGSGIVGDGLMGVMNFTMDATGDFQVTSYSQDSYLNTTGGTFYLQDQDGGDGNSNGALMTGNICLGCGNMTFDPTGRDGIAGKFAGTLGLQPWNIDNASDNQGTGLWETFTTLTSSNRTQGFTGGFTLTGSALQDAGNAIWTGTLVSAGNIGTAWGDFDQTQYSEVWDIRIVGTPSQIPVPAAVWLFGSGLLGLVGVARRKKSA